MADDPLWQKVLRGEVRPQDVPPPKLDHLAPCEVCKRKPELINGRIAIDHDQAAHGLTTPDGYEPSPRRLPDLSMPRRVGGSARNIFGERD